MSAIIYFPKPPNIGIVASDIFQLSNTIDEESMQACNAITSDSMQLRASYRPAPLEVKDSSSQNDDIISRTSSRILFRYSIFWLTRKTAEFLANNGGSADICESTSC